MGMGMSFFALCPFNKRHCTVPKNGMNCDQPMKVVCGVDSSGFSGQMSKLYKGIAKKDIPMPMVSPRVTIWPSTMAKNSFQKAKIVQKVLRSQAGFRFSEGSVNLVRFRRSISNYIIDYIEPGKYPVDYRPEHGFIHRPRYHHCQCRAKTDTRPYCLSPV